MQVTITVCDFCGNDNATPVVLQPLAIGMFEEPGVFKNFTTPASGRFNRVKADICEDCAEATAEKPIVQYTNSAGRQKVIFAKDDPTDD